ncbi:Glycoside hydrolase, catalytic domain-containing protein [Cynara cardunculus var. scolymus]|uniref:Glycoside hydrolase, catalytic domain-containing protein n=1 Tax=Cynara cardunculus var. scolymus TaxID=59895 RepID=A0A103XPK5_CYNCS|nr:Glycoside hydrolase, catalytic domain-containing protein [Cynara cardunculus var. scolymus]
MSITVRLLFLLLVIGNVGFFIANGVVDEYQRDDFPAEFVFGSGTSAYQVLFLAVVRLNWIGDGSGSVNAKGLQYYNNFINELLSHGIQPHVTLFHDDLPQILEDEYGGWISRKAVLGGYDVGFTPPGRCSSPFGFGNCTNGGNSSYEPYLVTHHLLLAHASAVRLYRKKYKGRQHGFVGINVFAYWFEPYTNTMEDLKATQRAHDFYLGWFLNPLVNGDYPETVKKNAGNRIPSFTKLESERIKVPSGTIGSTESP